MVKLNFVPVLGKRKDEAEDAPGFDVEFAFEKKPTCGSWNIINIAV